MSRRLSTVPILGLLALLLLGVAYFVMPWSAHQGGDVARPPVVSSARPEGIDHPPAVTRSDIDAPTSLPAEEWRIRVSSSSGKPIPDCAIEGETRSGERRLLGVTADSGELEPSPESIVGLARVHASADGYLAASQELPASPRGGVTAFVLQVAVQIAGRVEWADGSPAPGLIVTARQGSGEAVGLGQKIASGAPSGPGLLIGRTDEHGRFRLDGAEPGRRYVVAGGVPGTVTTELTVVTGGQPVTRADLTACAHHALLVQLFDSSGAPLDRPAVSFGSEYVTEIPSGVVSSPPLTDVQRLLAGMDADGWVPEGDGVLLQYLGMEDEPHLGPVAHTASPPGFVPRSIDLTIPRTTNGLEVSSIALDRAADRRGRIFIELIGWDAARTARGPTGGAPATLTLVEKATGRATDCYLRDPQDPLLVVEGVPFGTFDSWLAIRGGLEYVRPLDATPLSVGPSYSPTVRFDLRQSGALRVELADDLMAWVRGRILVHVQSDDVGLAGWMGFDESPGSVAFVRPGTYTVSVYALAEPDGPGVRAAEVQVVAGQVGRVVLGRDSSTEAPACVPRRAD